MNVLVKRQLLWEDEPEEDDENADECIRMKKKRMFVALALVSILSFEGSSVLGTGANVRQGNIHRDRSYIMKWSKELDNNMFRRQFRIVREDFNIILLKITGDLQKKRQQAINSSGSSISPYLMFMITLRILAGASYLDMIHYHVHVDSVQDIVWKTVRSLHRRLDNIKVASNEDEFLAIAREWSAIQLRRWGSYVSVGTIYAGDGFIIEICQPSVKDLRGRAISLFRNRKNIWALIAMGFCDAYTRFSVFDIRWPGGTNDVIAYNLSELCRLSKAGHFPEWSSFVLDEAYSSLGGMHLTPFSSAALRYVRLGLCN